MANFNRVYELIVSRPPSINSNPTLITPDAETEQVVDKEGDYRTEDLEAITITDLNLRGSVSSGKSKGSTSPFSATITGLTSNSLAYFEKNSVVILRAGYDNTNVSVLFAGQILTKEVDYSQETSTLSFTASEGYTPSNSVKVTKTFPANTTYQNILQFLIDTYGNNGIPVGRGLSELSSLTGKGLSRGVDEITLVDGYTIEPMYLDSALDKVCRETGFTWYLNKSKLYVEPEDYVPTTVESFVLSPNQVLSVSEIIPSNNNNSKDTQEANSGFRIKLLLDGRIDVGDYIEIDIEGIINGSFKVVNIVHNLEFEGESWFTTIEVQNV